MNWNEATGQLSFEQEQARKFDYFTTFYGNESARRVFAEIRTHIFAMEVTTPESAIAKLAQIDLIESIKESCGITDQLSVVNVEMSAAVKYEKPPKEETLLEI